MSFRQSELLGNVGGREHVNLRIFVHVRKGRRFKILMSNLLEIEIYKSNIRGQKIMVRSRLLLGRHAQRW